MKQETQETPSIRGLFAFGLLSALLLGALGAGWWILTIGSSPASESLRVDLSHEEKDATQNGAKPGLRIAVAAMISPSTTYKSYEGFLHHIGKILDMPVELVQRKTYQEVNNMLERREVDLAFVCSGPYVTGHDKFGLELLVAPVVHGQQVYHSLALVHRDSSLQSFEQLRGQTFAFTDPHSNTGCLVPRYLLARRGETPKTFFGEIVFSGSHDASIQAVAKGIVTGASVDSLIWEFLGSVDPAATSQTRILQKSPPYGIPPIVVHPSMTAAKKEELRGVFLNLHRDEAAKAFLQHLQIDRFDLVDDRLYDSVREMQKWVEKNQE